jgi:simple sugar transport system substrate-binding protein
MNPKHILGGSVFGAAMVIASMANAVTVGFSQVGDEGDWRPPFSKDMQ